jgi:Protein of unknown function (DUF3040)
MTGMSRKERLAWRRIERALREEAPELASLGADVDAGHIDASGTRVGTMLLAMAVGLIAMGTVAAQPQMLLGGLLVVLMVPPMVVLVVLANRNAGR